MMARHRKWFAAVCIVLATLVAGCRSTGTTDGSDPSAAAGSSNSAVCKDVASLKASVQKLESADVMANGLSAISGELTKIKQQLHTLKADANGKFSAQITDLSNALSGTKSSLSSAMANASAETLTALAKSIGSVVTAGNNLIMAVSSTC